MKKKLIDNEKINPAQINSEKMLKEFLDHLGFRSNTATFKNIKIIREKNFTDEPVRWLVSERNKMESHSVISIEENSLCVYYYDGDNDLFRLWDKYEGDIELSKIRDEIRSAMTMKTKDEHLQVGLEERRKEMQSWVDSINVSEK